MRKLLILVIGLILFALLGYTCVYQYAPHIQADIESRVTTMLKDRGLTSVNAYADGRDIILNGTVKNAFLRARAEKYAQREGVRLIDNQIAVTNPALTSNYHLHVIKNDEDELLLRGFVPDAESHHQLVAYAMEMFPESHVIDLLKQRADSPADWSVISRIGVEALNQLDTGKLELSHKKIMIIGATDSVSKKELVNQALSDHLPIGYQKITHIRINERKPEPENVKEIEQTIVEIDKPDEPKDDKAISKECQNQFNNALASSHIIFKIGSTELATDSYELLNKLASIARNCHEQRFKILGHTDSSGSKTVNMRLSEQRAYSVKKYLTGKGINAELITVRGLGDTQPIGNNQTLEGRELNRRIEIEVEGINQ